MMRRWQDDIERIREKHLNGVKSFEQFVIERLTPEVLSSVLHFRPQHEYLCENEIIQMDFVGRFESISTDYEKISNILNLNCGLPHLNNSARGGWENKYSAETRRIVGEIYNRDIEIFEY